MGIHLRPAGAMCDAAVKYDSHITFAYGEGKTANAKSVISILAAGIKCGDEIELIADGPDEQEALENVAAAFKESLKIDFKRDCIIIFINSISKKKKYGGLKLWVTWSLTRRGVPMNILMRQQELN